jgi:hypothetical protein
MPPPIPQAELTRMTGNEGVARSSRLSLHSSSHAASGPASGSCWCKLHTKGDSCYKFRRLVGPAHMGQFYTNRDENHNHTRRFQINHVPIKHVPIKHWVNRPTPAKMKDLLARSPIVKQRHFDSLRPRNNLPLLYPMEPSNAYTSNAYTSNDTSTA